MFEKLFRIKSEVKVIKIPRQNEGQVKEPHSISVSSVSLKSSGPSSFASNSVQKYFNNRLQYFNGFFRQPIFLVFFLVSTILSSYSDPNNYLFIILAVLIFIEWISIKLIEKNLVETLKKENFEGSFPSKSLTTHSTILGLLSAAYFFTAFLIIYFEIGAVLVTIFKLLGISGA